MKTHYLNGKLSLSELPSDKNRMNYIITDLHSQEQKSITDILEEIFDRENSVSKLVRVIGRIYDNNHTFNGMGNLHMCHDKSHIEGYCIGSMQFELQLFELVDRNVEIILEDYNTNFVIAEDLVSNDKAKSIIL